MRLALLGGFLRAGRGRGLIVVGISTNVELLGVWPEAGGVLTSIARLRSRSQACAASRRAISGTLAIRAVTLGRGRLLILAPLLSASAEGGWWFLVNHSRTRTSSGR